MARFDMSAEALMAPQGAEAEMFLNLGLMYATGRSVPTDLVSAHKWFNLAALRGNVDARRHRADLATEMSACEVAEAQRMAREWLRTH